MGQEITVKGCGAQLPYLAYSPPSRGYHGTLSSDSCRWAPDRRFDHRRGDRVLPLFRCDACRRLRSGRVGHAGAPIQDTFWFAILGYDPMVYLPLIFLIFFGVGWLIYPLIYRAVSGKRFNPVIMGLVFTFGLSIMAKGGALSAWGYHIQSITTWLSGKSISLDVVTIPALRFAGFVFGILVTLLFMIFLYKTKFGIIIRAAAQDRDTANLMGADVRKIGAFVYSLYAGITGMSGVLIGALFFYSRGHGSQILHPCLFRGGSRWYGLCPGRDHCPPLLGPSSIGCQWLSTLRRLHTGGPVHRSCTGHF